ncbi:MAG: hypothetical protein WBB45_00650 [Cyclobacteriaceae bacterium]
MENNKLQLPLPTIESFTIRFIKKEAALVYGAWLFTGESECTCPTGCTGGSCCPPTN